MTEDLIIEGRLPSSLRVQSARNLRIIVARNPKDTFGLEYLAPFAEQCIELRVNDPAVVDLSAISFLRRLRAVTLHCPKIESAVDFSNLRDLRYLYAYARTELITLCSLPQLTTVVLTAVTNEFAARISSPIRHFDALSSPALSTLQGMNMADLKTVSIHGAKCFDCSGLLQAPALESAEFDSVTVLEKAGGLLGHPGLRNVAVINVASFDANEAIRSANADLKVAFEGAKIPITVEDLRALDPRMVSGWFLPPRIVRALRGNTGAGQD